MENRACAFVTVSSEELTGNALVWAYYNARGSQLSASTVLPTPELEALMVNHQVSVKTRFEVCVLEHSGLSVVTHPGWEASIGWLVYLNTPKTSAVGDTPQEAALRCVVRHLVGPRVRVPSSVLEGGV